MLQGELVPQDTGSEGVLRGEGAERMDVQSAQGGEHQGRRHCETAGEEEPRMEHPEAHGAHIRQDGGGKLAGDTREAS